MAGLKIEIKPPDLKPVIEQAVRDVLITNIGSLWDQYCFDNNVPPEIKLHGIEFLEDFAKKINNEHGG